MTAFVAAALLLLAAPPPPPVSDADLAAFPSRAEAARQLDFAEAHVAFLLERVRTHGDGWGLRAWVEEATFDRDCWGALVCAFDRDFRPMAFWVDGDQLRYLRTRLGLSAYYRGLMPPAAPFRLFGARD